MAVPYTSIKRYTGLQNAPVLLNPDSTKQDFTPYIKRNGKQWVVGVPKDDWTIWECAFPKYKSSEGGKIWLLAHNIYTNLYVDKNTSKKVGDFPSLVLTDGSKVKTVMNAIEYYYSIGKSAEILQLIRQPSAASIASAMAPGGVPVAESRRRVDALLSVPVPVQQANIAMGNVIRAPVPAPTAPAPTAPAPTAPAPAPTAAEPLAFNIENTTANGIIAELSKLGEVRKNAAIKDQIRDCKGKKQKLKELYLSYVTKTNVPTANKPKTNAPVAVPKTIVPTANKPKTKINVATSPFPAVVSERPVRTTRTATGGKKNKKSKTRRN
jgi:hypothetical protein